MKIIYHCFGGTHSSVTAAAAHLGRLPGNRTPEPRELLSLPYFDTRESNDHGDITMMGVDKTGNEVYFVGQRGKSYILENVVHGLAQNFNIPANSYRLVNVMHKVNISMKIGGFMSRQFRWIKTGRPLVTLGTVRAYPEIIKLVRNVLAEESGG